MRLDGRRESTNVDDRRGRSSMKKAGGLGLGGLILVGIISLIMGGNPLDVIQQVGTMDQSSASQRRRMLITHHRLRKRNWLCLQKGFLQAPRMYGLQSLQNTARHTSHRNSSFSQTLCSQDVAVPLHRAVLSTAAPTSAFILTFHSSLQ